MQNLIIEASSWLKDIGCKTGSIQDRTKIVLNQFGEYIKSNKTEVEGQTGESLKVLLDQVGSCKKVFGDIISAYLRGVHYIAIKTARTFLEGNDPQSLPVGARLYKARASSSNYLYPQEEMFHIPYNKRCKIGNQRYSVSGMPCLYLASSSYVCWEELGRVDFRLCNYAGYSNKAPVPMYDFVLPSAINSLADVKRICVILACSLSADRDALFKEEYILPQCFLQALVLKHHYYHLDKRLFCVRYISVHALNGDANLFNIDFGNDVWVGRLYNYVFPAASPNEEGYNQMLKELFVQTETTSLSQELLLSPDRLISGDSEDVYLDSQFGLMDAFLDNKMGYKPLRKEATFLTV